MPAAKKDHLLKVASLKILFLGAFILASRLSNLIANRLLLPLLLTVNYASKRALIQMSGSTGV